MLWFAWFINVEVCFSTHSAKLEWSVGRSLSVASCSLYVQAIVLRRKYNDLQFLKLLGSLKDRNFTISCSTKNETTSQSFHFETF